MTIKKTHNSNDGDYSTNNTECVDMKVNRILPLSEKEKADLKQRIMMTIVACDTLRSSNC